ncbi:MAG: hypothetical protein ACLGH0_08000, partial [Thermoanaerobaculia bacterium]
MRTRAFLLAAMLAAAPLAQADPRIDPEPPLLPDAPLLRCPEFAAAAPQFRDPLLQRMLKYAEVAVK